MDRAVRQTNQAIKRRKRNERWRDEFRTGLTRLVDQAVVSGARQVDVSGAAIEEIERLRIANEHDSDLADVGSEDTSEEPANDWPVAAP